ncbi:MAG: VOC family protein [Oscillospiraceae bacterium]|nr:VOC family protein [Oscillospiraceae bacterium]
MIKNRKVGHIGFGTNDIEATAKWYLDVLGFKVIGEFMSPDNEPIKFLQNGDLIYEIWQPAPGQTVDCPGKIDHLCFESNDIEADYQYCKDQGYTFEEEGIQELPVWENGVRFFKIMSPSGEPVEFCQIL